MFIINKTNAVSQLEVSLCNTAITMASNMCHYIHGELQITNNTPKIKDAIFKNFINANLYHPCFSGNGKIYSYASLATLSKLVLHNETLVLDDPRVFCAAQNTLQIQPKLRTTLLPHLNGLPLINTYITGSGELILKTIGPIVTLILCNEKFISTTPVVAYSPTIKQSKQVLIKQELNPQFVHVFTGTGKIIFAPIPNQAILSQTI